MSCPRSGMAPLEEILPLLRAGETCPAIADRFGCSTSLIYHRLGEAGLHARDFLQYRPTQTRGASSRANARELALVPTQPEWMERSACRGEDPELFYAGTGDKAAIAAARRICRPCEVRADCLTYALQIDDRHGIWGGLTTGQRARLRKKRAS
ncbi:WhiB family transcriptional regulator [Phycicoccus sp. KQZ13P-1]|uniref:WhiB family transcriptional regulator n=1 Tax=Phycicoccus mangrovi TaxID=2840470 RepID=UPI001BFFF6B5|nr:WhiB family transcriptional regulator [Phycicoccus mangrovi]MBT9255407.1 WhiB family transcriptional regulator [Phycicoccus mangrovi]